MCRGKKNGTEHNKIMFAIVNLGNIIIKAFFPTNYIPSDVLECQFWKSIICISRLKCFRENPEYEGWTSICIRTEYSDE